MRCSPALHVSRAHGFVYLEAGSQTYHSPTLHVSTADGQRVGSQICHQLSCFSPWMSHHLLQLLEEFQAYQMMRC